MSLENVDDLIVGNDASEYTSADDGDGNSITKPSAFDNNAEETAEAEFDIDECAMDDLQMNGKKSRTSGIFMETQDEDVSVVESLTRSVEADGEESATEEEEEAPANTGPCEPDRSKLKRKVVQSLIDHTYYNYSLVNVYEELSRRSSQGQYKNPNRKGLTTNFPAKLHKILSNPEFRHIIRWMPHGRSWIVVDKDLMAKTVCKLYWNHESYESFNRSLNGWGFKRLWSEGSEKRQYYHECYLRGLPDHTKLMERLVNPGKRIPDMQGEPNFWNIAKDFPLPPDPYDDEPTGNGGDYEEEDDDEYSNSVQEASSPHSASTPRPPFPTRSMSLPTSPHGHGSHDHYHPYERYPQDPHHSPPASSRRHSNSCPPAPAHYDEHAPYPPPYFHPGSYPYNHPYHQRYYPSAHQHYSSSTVTSHPYGSVNVATSEYNSPKRDTNAHNPSVMTTLNATVPGEDTAEDERKPSADVTDTSAQLRSGGCEGFEAPVIWNGKPAGDQSPLPETKTTIGATPTVPSPSIDDVDMKERSVERKHDDGDEDATPYNPFEFEYNDDEAILRDFAAEFAKDD